MLMVTTSTAVEVDVRQVSIVATEFAHAQNIANDTVESIQYPSSACKIFLTLTTVKAT